MLPESEPSSWRVEPLARHHDRAAFSCGNDSLDHYLKEQAGQDMRRRVAAPFVLVSTHPNIILGYYTLSSFGIDLGDLPLDVAKKLPAYPVVPVTLLGRLAVDQRYREQALGEFLLLNALHRAYAQSSQIAAAAVVDAIDDPARRFYQHFDFLPFPDKPNRLFLPMKTIADLFRDS
ncbi:MAG: GNAT family N-acetyltransferase [Deltaproteobacteria bacterium RIFCSPLOWO2_12_FULL_60_19]|nr:MAG: GNAT family N-acetyltransferase [Deltaproteobacteria bacterium RIFCSPLOWO2_12_FULL_60_19]